MKGAKNLTGNIDLGVESFCFLISFTSSTRFSADDGLKDLPKLFHVFFKKRSVLNGEDIAFSLCHRN